MDTAEACLQLYRKNERLRAEKAAESQDRIDEILNSKEQGKTAEHRKSLDNSERNFRKQLNPNANNFIMTGLGGV